MKTASAPEAAHPAIAMVPFPPIEALPPLPPAPGMQPVSRRRLRAAVVGQALGVCGALMLLASLFIGGWYHVRHIDVTLGGRQMDGSYIGTTLEAYTNDYSLTIWAFLKRGYAIPIIVAAIGAIAVTLLVCGRRQRRLTALGLPFAMATVACIAADLRHFPATMAAIASDSPGFPSDIRLHGLRPGPMMCVAFGGLALQIGGTLLTFFCLPRVRRARRVSPAEREPEREEQPVDQLQPRGTGEYAVQGASALPAQTAEERWDEGQGEQGEQHPG
jgi:hypothetical protein